MQFTDGLIFAPPHDNDDDNETKNLSKLFPNYCQIILSGGSLLTNEVLIYGSELRTASDNDVSKYMVDSFERITQVTEDGITKRKHKLRLKLPWGHSIIEFQNKKIDIHCMRFYPPLAGKRDNGIWLTEVALVSLHGRKHLTDFIKAAKENAKVKKTSNDVVVYVQNDGYWPVLNKLPKRSLSTIYLDTDIKETLIKDVKNFLTSESTYQKFGIPYKRNYLFEGKAGLGKSSTIFAIASHFDLNIGMMSFGNRIDDALFMYALSHLPERTILVLEDIDCLFVKREKQKDSHNHLTFSGLLNGLDGIARRHGLLTFMTTNYPERLDSALVRPGRVDYRVKFTDISDNQIKSMIKELVPDQMSCYKKFLQLIRPYRNSLTPAALQQFLFIHKNEPNILDHMAEIETLCHKHHHNTNLVYL